MKLGSQAYDNTDPTRHGELVRLTPHYAVLRTTSGERLSVRRIDLRRRHGRPVKAVESWRGPDANLSRLAKANALSYEDAVEAMQLCVGCKGGCKCRKT